MKKLMLFTILILTISNCKEKLDKKDLSKSKIKRIVENNKLVFDGTSEASFEKSFERIIKATPEKERENLREAIGMLLIFGTGPMDDKKEVKWEKLRNQLNGMDKLQALNYIKEKAKKDYE